MSDQTTSAPTHTSDAARADAAYERRYGHSSPDARYAAYLQGWFDAVRDERRPGKVTYVPDEGPGPWLTGWFVFCAAFCACAVAWSLYELVTHR